MYNLASHPEVLDRILQTLAGAFDVIVSGMTVVEVLDDIWTFAVSRNLPALGTALQDQDRQFKCNNTCGCGKTWLHRNRAQT
jgi:hypothetical protein